MSELSSPQNLEEVCAYLELCVEEAKDKAWGEGISFALCFIKKLLPSAQPEIIRCKDCKFYREYGCQRAFVYPEPEDFCSRAERRTDGRD